MRAGVDANVEARKTAAKYVKRPIPAAGKAHLFPDFIEPARIAGIAALKIDGADTQPARDPDIDGIVLGQRTAGNRGRRTDEKGGGHLVLRCFA